VAPIRSRTLTSGHKLETVGHTQTSLQMAAVLRADARLDRAPGASLTDAAATGPHAGRVSMAVSSRGKGRRRGGATSREGHGGGAGGLGEEIGVRGCGRFGEKKEGERKSEVGLYDRQMNRTGKN
jgi:hypothetical protein